MEKRSPAIVFDFGGVLIDWNPRHLYRKLFRNDAQIEQFLDEIGFAEWNAQMDRGRPFSEAVAELCAQHPERAELIRAYDQRWDESVTGAIQPTVRILERLKQAGYPLYGLSNWSAEKFRRVRSQYPFLDWFDLILISGEVRVNKPEPHIFHLLLDRISRPAAECVFIDDSAANVATARALGFTTIHYQSAEQLVEDLQRAGIVWK